MPDSISPRLAELPSEYYLIFMWMVWGWELKDTATTVEQRDARVKHWDFVPGGGQVVWRRFEGTPEAADRHRTLQLPKAES